MKISAHFLVLVALSIFALAPLTAPGYFIFGHDARHSVYFLQMFDLSMRDGAWYPRWATDMTFGYGYPLWLILAPIPFYAGQAFHMVGFDFVSAVKAVDGLAVFFAMLAMYLFASKVLGKGAGLVAALAYVYIPYHLVDLYVRSSQAELVAYVFPPLVFWALYRLAETRSSRYVPLAALAYAGLVLSHIQTAVLFSPMIGLYIAFLFLFHLFGEKGKSVESGHPRLTFRLSSLVLPAASVVLGLGLSSIFLVPILYEQRYLTTEPLIGGVFDYQKHFVNASQLLSPFWGYGYAGENGTDQFSLQLGVIPVLLALAAVWGLAKSRGQVRWHIAFFLLIGAALVPLMLSISAPLWAPFASIVAYVQFPWRLLILLVFALAFLAGAAMHALPENGSDMVPALGIALVLVMASYAYTEPQHTDAVFNYQTQMEFEVKDGELLGDTVWMQPGARPKDSPLVAQYTRGQPLQKAIALGEGATVQMLHHGGQSDTVRVTAPAAVDVLFYTRYFPGWTATLDGRPAQLKPYGEQGLILVQAPSGSHVIDLVFQDTQPRQIGAVLSGVSFLVALAWLRTRRQGG